MKPLPIILLAALAIPAFSHAQLRVGGSDLLAPHLRTALEEYAEGRGIELEVDFVGSYHGLKQLERDELDLALVAIPDGGDLPEEGMRAVHFASKVATVAVAPANPLNQMTLSQLAGIYGEAEAVNITRWGQLGLTGEWSARSLTPMAVTPVRHSLTLELFRYTALDSRRMKRNITYFEDIDGIRRRFQQDNIGIALLHRIPEDTTDLKLLSVARSDGDLARAPTPETVAADEYPLRLPLYIVYRSDRGAEVREILRFLVSEEASEAIEEADLVPLPSPQRQRLFFEFERL